MKTYKKYKDSGINFIGNIPEHWEVKKVGHFLEFSRGLPITKRNLKDEGIPCVNYGEIHSKFGFSVNPEINSLKCVDENYLETSEQSLLKRGDFVFADTSEDIEGSGNFTCLNSDIPTFAGYHTIIIRHQNINYKFLAYYFDSLEYRNQIRSEVYGIKVFSITQAILKKSSFILPPKTEQTAIANYLDRKTEDLDHLIEEKKQLVLLYQEEKTAIINQAVTKGVNSEVKLKDSGIEWLGDIPEHWEVKPLKVMISKKIDNRGKTPQYSDTGKPMLEIKQISEKHKHPIEQFEKFVDINILQNYVRDELLEGDIIIATVGATAGKCCIVPKNPYYFIAQNVIGFRFHKEYSSDFVYYLIQSDFFKQSLYAINKSNTIDNLKVSVFVNNNVPTTEYSEQIEITQHIEKESARIDAKIAKAEKYINLLAEYRTAIISEVVTGKIKVID